MADSELTKAELIELDAAFEIKSDGKRAKVQFNPETLKVSYANQLPAGRRRQGGRGQDRSASGDQAGGASRQFVGAGTTKLALSCGST